MLQSKYSYDFKEGVKQTYRQRPISQNNFRSWTSNNRFRTVYHDSFGRGAKRPLLRDVAPGYKGFVPGLKSSNLHGSDYSALARTGFNKSAATNVRAQTSQGYSSSPTSPSFLMTTPTIHYSGL